MRAERKGIPLLMAAWLVCLLALTFSASARAATPAFNTILGRPTDHSITANIIPDQNGEAYLEYGTGPGLYLTSQTSHFTCVNGEPVEVVMNGLLGDTKYYYRVQFKEASSSDWAAGAEHSFRTQRAPGDGFDFTIVADSHLGQYGGQTDFQKSMYQQTLLNCKAEDPDFHIDLGDTSAMDPSPLGTGMTEAEGKAAWYVQRPFMGQIGDTVPIFLTLGNHENEEGWNWDDTWPSVPTDKSLALVGMAARKLYFPNPIPDGFYSGNTDPLPSTFATATGSIYHEDYYAWTWGDALFVVLDPYHYSMTWPSEGGTYGGEGQDAEVSGTRWDWTLGKQQYDWFKDTLENSTAMYKFVFIHHETGGDNPYGRGGVKSAGFYEWGGKNADGTWGFSTHRAGWGVDAEHPDGTPVHQLMAENGVTVFFHGHDHAYAWETLDGVAYQECPKPDEAVPTETSYLVESAADGGDHYPSPAVTLPASGHIRVTVSPTTGVRIDYVKTYLSGNGTNGEIAASHLIPPPGVTLRTLTYSAGTGGSISGVSPQYVVDGADGSPVQAVAHAGYHFVDWSDGSTANPRTDSDVTADLTMTANFAAEFTPVSRDGATSTNTAASASSINLTHTTGTGANRLTLVGVSWNCGTNQTISSATWTPSGGSATPLTLVKLQQAGTQLRYSAIYRLPDPPSGKTGTIAVTFSGSVTNGIAIGAANFQGVDPANPLGTVAGAGSTSQGTAPSVTVSGLEGTELVFDSVFMGGTASSQTVTVGGGQSEIYKAGAGMSTVAASTEQAGGSSVTMSWTAGSTAYWAIAAVPIRPQISAPPSTITVTDPPTGTTSLSQGSSLPVGWTTNAAVSSGEFSIWVVSADYGSWYGGTIVPNNGTNSYQNKSITVTVPPGDNYRIYVYWRPTIGSGAWSDIFDDAPGTVNVTAAAFSTITVSAPTGTTAKKQGDPLDVGWTTNAAVSSGEFSIWVVSADYGSWYGGTIVPNNGTNSYQNKSITVTAPPGDNYRIYVYWRPTIGSGAWSDIFDDAPGTVNVTAAAFSTITVSAPTGTTAKKQGDPLDVGWTTNAAVSSGEFSIWVVSADYGSWYGGTIVPNNGTNSYQNKSITVTAPPGDNYRIYVYWRPTIGSGAWSDIFDDAPGTVNVTAAAFSAITVSAPTGTTAKKQGDPLDVGWTTNAAVSSGEFSIWVVSADYGSWYGGTIVPNNGTNSYQNKSITVTVPSGDNYRIYVYWRPTIGSGAWSDIFDDAPGNGQRRLSLS